MDFFPVTLLRVEEVAHQTRSFYFSKPEGNSFIAGQYAMLRVPAERLVEPDIRAGMRPLSLASAPVEDELMFVMREGITGFKKTIWDLKVGETISVSGPLGHATIPDGDTRTIAILSGGVGVAPARSMLYDEAAKDDHRKFAFFYSNRFLEDAPFHKSFLELKLRDFTYVWTLTREEKAPSAPGEERGYINGDMIRKYLPEWRDSLYYVIGVPAFADSMKAMLVEMGISETDIHIDPFAGLTGHGATTAEKTS